MSRYRQNSGRGRDLLIFILLATIAAFAIHYYTQKPPAPKTIIVHEQAPPPVEQPAPAPIVNAPAPATEPANAAIPAPAPTVATVPVPPSTPQSQILEGELHGAQTLADRAKADLDAARASAIVQIHNSPDFIAAKADIETTRTAKDAAVSKLRADTENGQDTDEDHQKMHDAEFAWLTAIRKLNELQNQGVDADPTVTQKQQALKDASATAADLQKRLSACIQNDMSAVAKDDKCPIQSVAYDAATTSIVAILSPAQSLSSGEAADRALEQLGLMLEKVLRDAPFTWSSVLFRVNGKYNGQKAIEFQVAYSRDSVDNTNFSTIDNGASMDAQGLINLASDFWLSPLVNMMQDPNALQASVNSSGNIPYYAVSATNNGSVTYSNDVLVIGGYHRADGTYRNPIYIRKKHDNKNSSTPPSATTRPASNANAVNQIAAQPAANVTVKQSSSQ